MGGPVTVVWFRRDLRLEDNPALISAARMGSVVPVFIWAPEEEGQFQPGRCSRWWLKQSLMHLDVTLQRMGAPLILRRSADSFTMLLDIVKETGATQVFYNHLYDPVSLVRDHRVKQGLVQHGVVVHTFNADLLYEPWEVYDEAGHAFTVFENYWTKCLNMPFEPDAPLLAPKKLSGIELEVPSCSLEGLGLEEAPEAGSNSLLARAWAPGWSNADRALESFLRGALASYATARTKTDTTTTSLLSPHLHFGELSVRKIFHESRKLQLLWSRDGEALAVQSVDLFLRSIGLREYSRYLSFNFPFTHERSLLANLKSFPWKIDEKAFKAWRQGRTGYPLVDAGMRELWATGWLHNKIRVVASSFCVKFLQLPWRWGMKYFWDTLLDADLESDVLGWQYISGSLPDGHELDRMENPHVEGYKYDPEGEYVRRWLPELSRLPTEWVHCPWDAPPNVLRAAGVELGSNYPQPIVNIGTARERLAAALGEMWASEAALKAGGLEEGLGETTAEGAGHALSGFGRSSAGGSSRRDQMVPDMAPAPSQAAEEAARIILGHGQGAYQQELSSPTPPERTDASSAERPAEQAREPAGFRENVQDGAGLMREPQLPLRRGSESDMLSTAESSSLPRASEENPQQKPDPQKSWPYGNASLGPGGFQAVSEVARAKSFTGMGFNKKHMLELQDGTQLEDPLMKRSRMRQMASQAVQGGR